MWEGAFPFSREHQCGMWLRLVGELRPQLGCTSCALSHMEYKAKTSYAHANCVAHNVIMLSICLYHLIYPPCSVLFVCRCRIHQKQWHVLPLNVMLPGWESSKLKMVIQYILSFLNRKFFVPSILLQSPFSCGSLSFIFSTWSMIGMLRTFVSFSKNLYLVFQVPVRKLLHTCQLPLISRIFLLTNFCHFD